MIKEVTEFIENKAGLTRDTDLFAGHRPQGATDNCDTILESTGSTVFFDLPERADAVIQVLSRGETYFTARARAWAIYDAIYRDYSPLFDPLKEASAGWTLPDVVGDEFEAMVIEPISTPQYIGTDEKLRHEFSTNYIFRIRKI